MGKNAGRITVFGFAMAVSAAVAFPMTAMAADSPSPTLSGDCDATLQNGKTGDGLTLDAGAPLNAPNRLTVGLDSKAKSSRDGRSPLLTLPVGDVVRGLGVGEVPVVGDAAANTVCPAAQSVVNGVGNGTQGLLQPIVKPPVVVPPNDPTEPPIPIPPNPPKPGEPGNQIDPVVTGPGGSAGSGGDALSGIFTGNALLPANFVQAPVITTVIPGQTVPLDGQVPTVDEQKSGSAQALPAAMTPAKLPLLLAVLALAVVAAALVRVWLRRKPA
ncbi:hypothetical protein [Amycolatopsis sp. H20-H5]|uniref:hypothetical protein n=1 Tax=Amycolatopsis sp. H20-H5 TaxID=3046309 RepID=UPI002DBB4C1B|nr:hypothetical protein [Amycolatopsis sp. H20-H5]MEC3974682.1 hypothetical protein [Amycolatopsis sp. H20-H5]